MSSKRSPDDPQVHQELVELLPWYLNGTLSEEERRRLDGHLPRCAECRSQLEEWRNLATRLSEADAVPLPHPAGFRRLLERLAADGAPSGGEEDRGARRAARRWRWLSIAQAAAIVLLVWTARSTARPPSEEEPTFHTLAAEPATAGESWRLRIVFSERTSERELRTLLLPLDATFVGGPTPLGVYTVAIPARFGIGETVAALRARSAVQFAEPVSAAGADRP